MASNARIEALIDRLLAEQSPLIRAAFIEAMRDARDAVQLQEVISALSRGDIEAAAQALDIQRTFLAPLDQAIASAYFTAGRAHNELLLADLRRGGLTVEIRFDPGAPRAAQWVRQHSSALVTEIVEDQRAAVREALGAGLDAGRNPRTVALDIVGRMDRVAKRRAGGIIGLTSGQARFVENARAQLSSGDPAQMREYLGRSRRDRRFDKVVRQAIREVRSVAAVDVQRITARYSDRLLAFRGEVVGRTESLTALSYAQDENVRQAMEAGGIRSDQVRKRWGARLDKRTRDSHVALNGKEVGLSEAFVSPTTGARMMFPRDSSLGASGSDTVACRCHVSHSFDWGA